MEPINDFFSLLSSFLWGWPMIILLLGTHVFLTFRLRIPQRKLFTGIKLSIKKDTKAEGDVSQFGALATALAATIGTGNIVGVATAVALGGRETDEDVLARNVPEQALEKPDHGDQRRG